MQATTKPDLVRQNLRLVKLLYPTMPRVGLVALRDLTKGLRLSVSHGDILCIDGKWYVTHAGLLRIALRRRCRWNPYGFARATMRPTRRPMGV